MAASEWQTDPPSVTVCVCQYFHVDYSHSSTMLLNQTTDNYNCLSIHAGEKNQITGQSMSYPGTIGGAVPISTSGNRDTSGWPLCVTSGLGIWKRCRTKSEEKLHLSTFCVWGTWSLHKLDAQWRSCLWWFRRTAAAAAATTTALLLPAPGQSRACTERKIWSDLMECVHTGVMRLSIQSGQVIIFRPVENSTCLLSL